MAENQQVQVVRDLIASLVASWPEGYAGVRAVLEALVEALPVQGPHPARMAARDYMARHCQMCGAPVSRMTDDTVNDLEALRNRVTVPSGPPEILCSGCYVRLVEDDDTAWLAELREAQHERPLGLFGRPVATVLADNRDQRQRDQSDPAPAPDAWPPDYVEATFGSLPELERFPQGTYERRDPLD